MKGLPFLFFLIALVSVGIRILKAVAEAQQNRKDDWVDGDSDGGDWTEWKNARNQSAPQPPPPPRPPQQRTFESVAKADGQAAPKRMSAKEKLQQVLEAARQELEGRVPEPPPAPQQAETHPVVEEEIGSRVIAGNCGVRNCC
jgi:hypothetical protein